MLPSLTEFDFTYGRSTNTKHSTNFWLSKVALPCKVKDVSHFNFSQPGLTMSFSGYKDSSAFIDHIINIILIITKE